MLWYKISRTNIRQHIFLEESYTHSCEAILIPRISEDGVLLILLLHNDLWISILGQFLKQCSF
jgi:hypothetical protein